MAKIRKIYDEAIKPDGSKQVIYPITSTRAVYTTTNVSMDTLLNEGYRFGGVVLPTDSPVIMDQRVFYGASVPGVYTNFGGISVDGGEAIFLMFDGTSWRKGIFGGAGSNNLTGFKSLASISDLPLEETTLGYLIEDSTLPEGFPKQVLYVWVGEGGDTLEGLYQNCGQLRGASAYESAVRCGYEGTVEEWLNDPVNGIKGNGIQSMSVVGEYSSADSATNTYRITPNVGESFDFNVKNGTGISNITETPSIANGGTNVVHITKSNGDTYDIHIKNGSASDGFFATSTLLNTAIPSPNVGDYAFVSVAGDGTFPAYIYVCETAGTWTNSNQTFTTEVPQVSVSQNTETGHTDISVGGVTTPVASVAEVNQLGQDKVEIKSGVNLIDAAKFITGKGINPTNGNLSTNADLNVSDYIVVNGNDIISNSYATQYWGGAVYDADKHWLRGLTTTQYEYQAGDAYIRLTYLATTSKPCANYGTVLQAYRPYNPVGGYMPNEVSELSTTQDIVFRRGILNSDGTIRYTSSNKTLISSPIYGNKTIILPDNCVVARINYYNATTKEFISSTYLNNVGSYNVVCGDNIYAVINVAKVDSSAINPEEINQSFVLTQLQREASDSNYLISMIVDALNNPVAGYTQGANWETSGGKSVVIPVKENDNIILRSTSSVWCGFMTDFEPDWLYLTPVPWVSEMVIGQANQDIVLTAPSGAKYLYVNVNRNNNNRSFSKFFVNGYDYTTSLRDNVGAVSEYIRNNKEVISESKERHTFDVASNNKFSFGTSKSNTEASCLVDEPAKNYVSYHKLGNIGKRNYHNERIVAINFDDLAKNDYIGTRKILNKYGFNANFNFILYPFSSVNEMNEMVANVKQLIKDGNDLGLHAIMQESFWIMNKMFDIRPNFTVSFAPILDEVKTVVADSKNVFGYTITSTTKFADAGFVNPPSSLANINVVDATNTDFLTLIANYCLYYMSDSISGVDLQGNVVSKTALQWLEYWYNELIDSTLGYSINSSSTGAKFADDYDFPSGGTANQYYPEANHLLSGRMVFFDDTENEHYSEAMTSDAAGFNDSKWQLVGRFKKGLFKGCASCCNYEVIDRCIDIATAFVRHYFGVEGFTNFGRHGVRYAAELWRNDGGVPFDNRAKTVIAGEVGKFYQSRTGCFVNVFDVLLSKGIRMTNHMTPIEPIFESQVGLYFGQEDVRYPFFNHVFRDNGAINYLALFGTSSAGVSEPMDYETFISYMGFRDNWLKFAYENGGQTIHKKDGSGSMYMFYYLRNFINIIRGCLGTGKIPVFSLDTIKVNAATLCATELLCQYCYANDIDIVPVEYARKIANSKREYRQNWFPNPNFTQSVLNALGGNSTEKRAYMPDGWILDYAQYNTQTFEVLSNEVENKRVLHIDATNGAYYDVSMFGLPAGTYKFSYYSKKTKGTSKIRLFRKKNSDYLTQYYNGQSMFSAEDSYNVPTDWALHEYEFTIDEPYRGLDDNTIANKYAYGYENNVVRMVFQIELGDNSDVLLHSPKVERV